MAVTEATRQRSITVTVDGDGIATLLVDRPDNPVNAIDPGFIADLEEAVAGLGPDLRGLVVASGKDDQFVAGADLHVVLQATKPGEADEIVRRLQQTLNRLASLPYPTVAAINGPALGGGLELALACDYRVVVESELNMLGLPEVQLGLLPAGGGTQRLPRLIGLSRALSLILEAKRYSSRRARAYGVVDEVVHPAVLQEAARAWLARGKRTAHPRWTPLDRAAERLPLLRQLIYRQAAQTVRKQSKGHYPAPGKALDAVRVGMEQGVEAGLAAEATSFGQLAADPVAHNLIHLFFATEGLKKEQKALVKRAPAVERVGVVGAGFMGAGIAQAAAVAGYGVRLRDVDLKRVGKAIASARDLTRRAARRGRFSRREAQAIVSRLSGTTDYSGFRRAQLVIEAVFEDVAVKRQVIAELEEVLSPEAVIASNTSSLPIGSLAAGARHPQRIVGMHFFSPVHRMPLLEVVQAERSSPRAVATAVEAGRAMGKTVIVVQDGPGFYTTRVLGFMMAEAGRVFADGAAIEQIDRAMVEFGFPVGPLALTDEVGIDVAAHVSEILAQAFPARLEPHDALQHMAEMGRLGRKSGAGFYDYSARRKKPDPAVYALRSAAPQHMPPQLIQRRLVLTLVNEAIRCLEEGVIASPRDGDVGAIMGFGFPPFRGGPFRYADSLGTASLLEELRELEQTYGPRFAPPALLARMAEEDKGFYEDDPHPPAPLSHGMGEGEVPRG